MIIIKNNVIFFFSFSSTEGFIYATWNWWGFNERAAISGRIKDSLDSEELLSVTYEPFLPDNSSVLSGMFICYFIMCIMCCVNIQGVCS